MSKHDTDRGYYITMYTYNVEPWYRVQLLLYNVHITMWYNDTESSYYITMYTYSVEPEGHLHHHN